MIRGEPDASSFPSGGIRSASQARGYTTWDPSSPPFILSGKNGATLYIPCCFCSWTGAALDVKTPLLRSIKSLSENSVRLLRLLGDEKVKNVYSSLGSEQEFFLIDRAFYTARPDIIYSGRTIIGAKPPKGQNVADHYYARIPPRVLACIQEAEAELWKLGIPSKGRHNEVAPSQYEMTPIFEHANLASDHNMIMMDVLRDVAEKHGLTCLLHEKPFDGINGSGKHNNWSISTDYGLNLLEPSKQLKENLVFHVFLSCVLRAVDLHADLLRAFVAIPGNDFRLGEHEAPPSIISVYLGSDITELVNYLLHAGTMSEENQQTSVLNLGYTDIPPFVRDKTDRNRTSPFAFTGNKFEFRAVGSSQSVGHTCTVINTIVSDSIQVFSDRLEELMGKENLNPKVAARKVVFEFLQRHQRIIFNGNSYSTKWHEEALRRNLPNYSDTVSALERLKDDKNIEVFNRLGVLSPDELLARANIHIEHYCRTVNVEAKCALNLSTVYVLPAAMKYQKRFAFSLNTTKKVLNNEIRFTAQERFLKRLSTTINALIDTNDDLSSKLENIENTETTLIETARKYRDIIRPLIQQLRFYCDSLEEMIDDDLWLLPKYADILYLK